MVDLLLRGLNASHSWEGDRPASLLSLQSYMHVRHLPGNPHLPCLPGHINEDSELSPA